MTGMYHQGSRDLQDRFDTRRLADRLEQAEAQFMVRVLAKRIYPNCPRYIHHYALVERSAFVPRARRTTPIPAWKQADWASDVLPAGDPARPSSEHS